MMSYSVCFRVVKTAKLLENKFNVKKIHPKEAFDTQAGSLLCEVATAHVHYYIFNSFFEKIISINNEDVRAVLSKLCTLWIK